MASRFPVEDPERLTNVNFKPLPVPMSRESPDMPPLTRMQAGLLTGLRSEVALLVKGLRPLELTARIEQERKGGLTGPKLDARVSGTVAPKEPKLDARDRTLNLRQKDYERALRNALASLQTCVGIETEVLVAVHVATEKERRAASDMGVDCLNCTRPVACTPADRLRAGRCSACFQYRQNHDGAERPEELWS